jgi:predicted nucleic acid-binding protein
MPSQTPPLVFIDANIFIADRRPPGGDTVRALKNLARSQKLRVLTTDLTILEIIKHFSRQDEDKLPGLSKRGVRTLIKEIVGVEIPEIDKHDLRERIWSRVETAVRDMLAATKAEIISIDGVTPSSVFSAYARGTGIFDGSAKKDQFPDAFIFEALKERASKEKHLFILSSDSDFAAVASGLETITHLKSVADLLQRLDLEISEEGIEEFIRSEEDRFGELILGELRDRFVTVNDGFSDLDGEITSVNQLDFVNIDEFQTQPNEVFVTGRVSVSASVSYSGPDMSTATYDSEDKVAYPFRDISGEGEFDIDVDFTMTVLLDSNGVPEEIESVSVTGDDYLSLSTEEDYR